MLRAKALVLRTTDIMPMWLKRQSFPIVFVICMSWSFIAQGQQSHIETWQITPGITLVDLIDHGATVISTDALIWPDGRPALIIYLQTEGQSGRILRCIDWYDKNFLQTGSSCSRQVDPRRE